MIFKLIEIGDGNGSVRRRWTMLKTPWFQVLLHRFLRSDKELCLHGHPWWFVTCILWGGYWEWLPCKAVPGFWRVWRRPGSILFRPVTFTHRVELDASRRRVWTLVVTGRNRSCERYWARRQDPTVMIVELRPGEMTMAELTAEVERLQTALTLAEAERGEK